MNAGKYRHLVRLEKPVTGFDDYGVALTGWELVRSVYAELRPQSSREARASNQMQGYGIYTVNMRPVPGLNESWRLVYLGEIYNIKGKPIYNADRSEITFPAEVASYEQA